MSSQELLQLAPPDQWYTDRPNGTYIYHPFDKPNRTPDEANYNKDPLEAPTAFESDADWADGMDALRGSNERSEEFGISVLLTDPSRPDGFGSRSFLEYAIDEFDMVAYASTRSAFHSIRQHGHAVTAGGIVLGDPRPHEDYQGQLDDIMLKAGKPAFSYDPSTGSNEPSTRLVQSVQNVRTVAYVEASKQRDMAEPDRAFFVPDMVGVNTLQWLQTGIIGLKMQEIADERWRGELPENLLIIAPAEHGALIHKLGVTTQNPDIQADVARKEFMDDPYMRDQYLAAYNSDLQEGYLPLTTPKNS